MDEDAAANAASVADNDNSVDRCCFNVFNTCLVAFSAGVLGVLNTDPMLYREFIFPTLFCKFRGTTKRKKQKQEK